MTRDVASARAVALDVLGRIDAGARSGGALAAALESSELSARDRAFVTELVQGTTRMRRACDHLIEPFVRGTLDPPVRALLRLGAYQLAYLATPRHAAVAETVEIAPRKVRGLVNAILRRVADALDTTSLIDVEWPSPAVELSYPDWLVERAVAEWADEGHQLLRAMNHGERPEARPDGYVQGRASQWVVAEVDALRPDTGGVVLDLCAAPGGKTTGLSPRWGLRVGAEIDEARSGVLQRTVDAHDDSPHPPAVVRADATAPPFRRGGVDVVLLDAPCSGLGALGRRSDARWRASASDIDRLAAVQSQMLEAASSLVAPGGAVVYSVCTWTNAESVDVVGSFLAGRPDFEAVPLQGDHWRRFGGDGGVVLPHDHGTDAMACFVLQRTSDASSGA